jgi:hypothetical protein
MLDEVSCTGYKITEATCCPGSADNTTFICDYCSGGIENPNTELFTGGTTCADYAGGQVLQHISLYEAKNISV